MNPCAGCGEPTDYKWSRYVYACPACAEYVSPKMVDAAIEAAVGLEHQRTLGEVLEVFTKMAVNASNDSAKTSLWFASDIVRDIAAGRLP